MPRTKMSRPARERNRRRRVFAANEWYYAECGRRDVPMDEAELHWTSLTPQARIRRFMSAVRSGDVHACEIFERRFGTDG